VAKINLLPKELGTKGKYAKAAAKIKQITIVSSLFVLVLGLIGGVYIFIINNQLQKLGNSSKQFEQKIRDLNQTEIRLLIVKDRLGKVKQIQSDLGVADEVPFINTLVSKLPSSVTLSEADIDKSSSEYSFVAASSLGLAQLLSLVVASSFEEIVLEGINFNPSLGYLVTIVTK
jgi:hypothetical protein